MPFQSIPAGRQAAPPATTRQHADPLSRESASYKLLLIFSLSVIIDYITMYDKMIISVLSMYVKRRYSYILSIWYVIAPYAPSRLEDPCLHPARTVLPLLLRRGESEPLRFSDKHDRAILPTAPQSILFFFTTAPPAPDDR
jgi:hypothetical protein